MGRLRPGRVAARVRRSRRPPGRQP